jgi:hypothetical protein
VGCTLSGSSSVFIVFLIGESHFGVFNLKSENFLNMFIHCKLMMATKKSQKTSSPIFKVPYRIFLSHSSKDKNFVNLITVMSKLIDIDVYRYDHDIQPGVNIAEKLKQAIKKSDAMIVLLSEESQFSPYVHQEIGMAEISNKPIIPLVQIGLGHDCLAMLQGREHIPFDFNNPIDSLSKLDKHLRILVNKKQSEQYEKVVAILLLLIIIICATSKK